MQMAKTCAAVERLHAARQSFIVIMTHPTYGGVTASFASLGDVIFAEPKAMIGFFIVKSPAGYYIPPSPQKNAQVWAKDDIQSEEPVEEQVAVIAKRGQQGDVDG